MTSNLAEDSKLDTGYIYSPQLDSLRAIAIIGVLLGHFWDESFSDTSVGPMGVRLFFVLSGFLITRILLNCRESINKKQNTIKNQILVFYSRRFLRIFPIYYLLIGFWCAIDFFDLVATLQEPAREVAENIWWFLTYTSNFLFAIRGDWLGVTGHLWSLAVEEQFYVIWPLIVFTVPRRLLLPAIIVVVASGPIFRGVGWSSGLNEVALSSITLSVMDSLGLGALLAYVDRYDLWRGRLRGLCAALVPVAITLAAGMIDAPDWFYVTFLDLIAGLAFVWLVAAASRGISGPVGVLLSWRPLVYVGRISYGAYLYHLFVPWILASVLGRVGLTVPETQPQRFLILTAATLLAASLSWHIIERPLNGLKRYIPYRSGPAVAARPLRKASNSNR
jgi:peptidoglycan/LPS O-acetylase OafA/YrhL